MARKTEITIQTVTHTICLSAPGCPSGLQSGLSFAASATLHGQTTGLSTTRTFYIHHKKGTATQFFIFSRPYIQTVQSQSKHVGILVRCDLGVGFLNAPYPS